MNAQEAFDATAKATDPHKPQWFLDLIAEAAGAGKTSISTDPLKPLSQEECGWLETHGYRLSKWEGTFLHNERHSDGSTSLNGKMSYVTIITATWLPA